jgi:hypothetical protein
MLRRNIDAKAEAAKLASLSIVWGVAAAVAYLGGIHKAIDLLKSATNAPGLDFTFDSGLIALATPKGSAGPTSLVTLGITALPIAIIATLVLGFLARAKPTMGALPVGLVLAAAVGLIGGVGLFLNAVNTNENRTQFIAALATIVLVSILLRISKGVRRFYRSNPALVSAIIGIVSVAYLFLLNGANIPGILLTEIDIWLALASFGIVLYSGINMIGLGMRARRGGK